MGVARLGTVSGESWIYYGRKISFSRLFSFQKSRQCVLHANCTKPPETVSWNWSMWKDKDVGVCFFFTRTHVSFAQMASLSAEHPQVTSLLSWAKKRLLTSFIIRLRRLEDWNKRRQPRLAETVLVSTLRNQQTLLSYPILFPPSFQGLVLIDLMLFSSPSDTKSRQIVLTSHTRL